jgi:hypothetical protein
MVPVRIPALLIAGVLAASPLAGQEPVAVAVAVVMHDAVRDRLDVPTVRRLFLARQRFWRDGTPARPVNQGARAPLRDLFSRRALGAPAQEFTEYWNDLWFHGTSPPPVLGSDQAVLLFVARTPGAVGYVDAESVRDPPAGVRVGLILGAR